MHINTIVSILGFIFLAKITYGIVLGFYRYFIRSGANLKKYGSWAIITGCTDGIGAAIANEFAKKGINLILISRTPEKLHQQAKDLETKFKINTETVAIDFTKATAASFEPVQALVNRLEVGILVNNVGIAYDHAEYFHALDQSKIMDIIHVNVTVTTQMTHLVLPQMVQRKRGAIINVSSASSLVSEPLYAVYTGTKAYINNFSEALHHEYKKYNIDVQAALPGLVTSKLSKVRQSSFFIPSPAAYARTFVAQIGYEPISVTYWTHAIQFGIALTLPRKVMQSFLLSRGLDIRTRAYRKKEAEKKQ